MKTRAQELVAALTGTTCEGCRSNRAALSIRIGDLNSEAHKAARSRRDQMEHWKGRIAEAKARLAQSIEFAEAHLAEAHETAWVAG